MQNVDNFEVMEAAIGLITPTQTVFGYSTHKHDYTAERMYDLLYEDFYDYFKDCDYDFRRVSKKLGVICVQLISKYYSVVWLPEKVNEYQFSQLVDFAKSMYEINNELEENNSHKVLINAGEYSSQPSTLEDSIVKMSHNLTDEFIGKERVIEKVRQKVLK